jgi:hypothetical protein
MKTTQAQSAQSPCQLGAGHTWHFST